MSLQIGMHQRLPHQREALYNKLVCFFAVKVKLFEGFVQEHGSILTRYVEALLRSQVVSVSCPVNTKKSSKRNTTRRLDSDELPAVSRQRKSPPGIPSLR